jgi:hypothetical protein
MKRELADEFLQMVEVEFQSKPSALVFEMAYQSRVAVDRIKFAIQQTERFPPNSDQVREANLQLLDALERLQQAERHFQDCWRMRRPVLGMTGHGRTEPCEKAG